MSLAERLKRTVSATRQESRKEGDADTMRDFWDEALGELGSEAIADDFIETAEPSAAQPQPEADADWPAPEDSTLHVRAMSEESEDAARPVAQSRPQAAPAQRSAARDAAVPAATSAQPAMSLQSDQYYEIKNKIHDRLIDLLDLSLLERLSEDEVRTEIGRIVEGLLWKEFSKAPLNLGERKTMLVEIQDEVLGLGPLEPFVQDPTVNDILVNGYKQIYVERNGKLELTSARFKDDGHLRKIIDRIVSRVGRRIDESQPMVDARLLDGSRVNAVIPPLALDGPSMSIRKFSRDPLEVDDLINFGAMTPAMAKLMEAMVHSQLNIIISGGTGSGKTTLLNCLSRFVPEDERIVTIEDAAELQLKQEHVVRLETRPRNIEGTGEVTMRDLVKNCLRMRPDRIIVGEVRSSEALDMLQAMNTGHDGSLTTIHANSPRDALMRLETMVSMAGMNLDALSLKRYIASAVDVIIQATRLVDGSRKVISIQEVTGMEGDVITMQEIFTHKQTGVDPQGKIVGHHTAMGIRPKCAPKLEAMGRRFDNDMFLPVESERAF